MPWPPRRDDGVQAVVVIGAGAFIAGADVSEFGKPPVPPFLPDVVARFEARDKPRVAAIHGVALGGGLEIALGCHYRMAVPAPRSACPRSLSASSRAPAAPSRLPRLIGRRRRRRDGDQRPPCGAEALELGLIDAVLDGDLRRRRRRLRAEAGEPLPAPLRERPPPRRRRFLAEAESGRSPAAPGRRPRRSGRSAACARATEADFDAARASSARPSSTSAPRPRPRRCAISSSPNAPPRVRPL